MSGKHKSAKGFGDALRTFAGYPNVYDLTEAGAHRVRWIQRLQEWKLWHHYLALPTMGPDVPVTSTLQLQFGSDFVVLVLYAHNGLQVHGTIYTGLSYKTVMGNTMFDEYRMLMEELTSFSQVVYGFSPCWERFDMDNRLAEEAHACAVLANAWGHISCDLSDFGESIK
ncbi:MAG: hypothetical protein ACKPKO_16940, partial [Candidatus Fonsibacter sp.]